MGLTIPTYDGSLPSRRATVISGSDLNFFTASGERTWRAFLRHTSSIIRLTITQMEFIRSFINYKRTIKTNHLLSHIYTFCKQKNEPNRSSSFFNTPTFTRSLTHTNNYDILNIGFKNI